MAIAVVSLTGNLGGNGSAVSTFTVAKPTGLADGCVAYLAVGSNNGAASQGSQTICTDATWVRLVFGEDTATANVGITVFRRVVVTAASEPANYAFAFVSHADDTTSQTCSYGYVMGAFSGVDTVTPEDVTVAATTGTTSASTTTTTATSSVSDNAWAVACCAVDIVSATWVAPAGYSTLVGQVTGRSTALASMGPITPAGAIAAAVFTNTAGGPGVGTQVVLDPAGGVPPPSAPAPVVMGPGYRPLGWIGR